MTKRRRTVDADARNFTPEILKVYKRARKLLDDATSEETLHLTEFPALQERLNVLLGRTAPWLFEIFDTVDEDEPPVWLKDDVGQLHSRHQRWLDAKAILTALEEAAK